MRKISEILQDKRLELGYSVDHIVKITKIKRQFIIAIENGNYYDLPSESYALGFVKNYAQCLGIEKAKAAALFRREYEGGQQKLLPTFKSQDKSLRKRILITPKSIMLGIVVLVVCSYIAFQYSSFLFGPKLLLEKPANNSKVSGNIVEVLGKTDPYASVLINNEEAYVQLDGTFKKTLYLFSGKRQIVVTSKNRNGKETKKIIQVAIN